MVWTLEALPEAAAADADCVVIITDHAAFDYQGLVERSASDRGYAQCAEGCELH